MQKYTVKVFDDRTEWRNSNGLGHREDGPAVEYTNGNKYWFKNGKLHREDGPAVEWANGNKEWWLNGKHLTKKEWQKQLDKFSCDGKIVEIEGKKYQLKEI